MSHEHGYQTRHLANSLRQPATRLITEAEQESIIADAIAIGIDPSKLSFNTGTQTSYNDRTGLINVRGDIFPDLDSSQNRDRMSVRAVLAHEYYGHAQYPNSVFEPGYWADEFRASYQAAKTAPGLDDEERAMLMIDAYERAADAGVAVRYTTSYRRIVYGY